MDINNESALRKRQLAEEATEKGRILFDSENFLDEFNLGCDHILSLFDSAYHL